MYMHTVVSVRPKQFDLFLSLTFCVIQQTTGHPRLQFDDQFCNDIIRSADIFYDTQVKRGAVLSADHHLVES